MKRIIISILCFFCVVSAIAQKKYDVVLPKNYDAAKSYPLFIVLHGGHGNKEDMQSYWYCQTLSDAFIVVYMEASTIDRAPNRFGWRDLKKERLLIKDYYSELIESFSIDTNNVFVGGFSLGAKTSIDITLGNVIPIKGFILLNLGGGLSDNCTAENVQNANKRMVKGVVMMGEFDDRYKSQTLALKTLLDDNHFTYKFIVNKETGHTTPKNFNRVLDESIAYLTQ